MGFTLNLSDTMIQPIRLDFLRMIYVKHLWDSMSTEESDRWHHIITKCTVYALNATLVIHDKNGGGNVTINGMLSTKRILADCNESFFGHLNRQFSA